MLLTSLICLSGCQVEIDEFSCEYNTNMTCDNYDFPESCKKGQDVFPWLFQKTWFIKPERDQKYFGAIFGDKTAQFWQPDEERDGNYCIDDKTIIFKNDVPNSPVERIKIIKLVEGKMILKFESGEEITYYNPN